MAAVGIVAHGGRPSAWELAATTAEWLLQRGHEVRLTAADAERCGRPDLAVPGDELWVSGQPGLAALGLAQLQGRTQLPAELARRCLDALQRPMARVELGLELRQRGLAHAAIDVSDGLLADLDHILKRSGVAAEVFVAQLPPLPTGVDPLLARQCQLAGGDDYELVFSAPPDKRAEITELAAQLALPLWRFGLVVGTGDSRLRLLDADGQAQAFNERGFDHFG